MPFRDAVQRAKHFKKHGKDFGTVDELEYERMADTFMSQPLNSSLHECRRTHPPPDVIRLDESTRFFSVAYNSLTIRTFHLKDESKIVRHGGAAGYVAFKCAEV